MVSGAGSTARSLLHEYGHEELVEIVLLSKGAEIDIIDVL